MNYRSEAKWRLGAAKNIYYSFIGRRSKERKMQAYCVGLPRSGTHSMGYMFSGACRAAHEADALTTAMFSIRYDEGKVSSQTVKRFIQGRDKRLNLEFESSHYMYRFAPLISEIYPNARFIATIRDPYTWIQSELNQNDVSRNTFWREYQNHIYEKDNRYLLTCTKANDLFPIGSYLEYWLRHIKTITSKIDQDKVLYLNTENINKSISKVCDFLNVEKKYLNLDKKHSGKRKKNNIKIKDKEKLIELIRKKCAMQIQYVNSRLDKQIKIR